MSARHTPPGDRSFAASLVRHVAAGAALVAVVALVFWGIGRFRTPTPDGPVISAPTAEDTGSTEQPTDTASPAEPTSPTSPTSPTAPTSPAPSPTASPAATADGRSSITVQVLSATGGDGERMQEVVQRLRELGYQVVAEGRAVRTYDRSTVFYTDGHREDALMIQQDIPELGVLEEKPDNLSDTVDAHIIVGLDYPES